VPVPAHPCVALSAYVDDRLPPWRRAVVERHLLACTACAVEVAQIRSLRTLLDASETPAPTAELHERLLGIAGPDGGGSDGTGPDGSHPQHSDADVPGSAAGPRRLPGPREVRPRTAAGAVGVLVAGVVLVGAAGAGAVATSSTPWPGTAGRASLSTVVPRLITWQTEPDAADTVRGVDNGDRP